MEVIFGNLYKKLYIIKLKLSDKILYNLADHTILLRFSDIWYRILYIYIILENDIISC